MRRPSLFAFASSLLLAAAWTAPCASSQAEPACEAHDPLRRPFFGDTHVHTALSFDAMGQGTRAGPRDAYRFARGEAIGLPPFDAEGFALRTMQLRRPLDFAMVSDHAELLGETRICTMPGLPGHDAYACVLARRWPRLGYALINGHVFSQEHPQRLSLCGEDASRCLEAARTPWHRIQQAAESATDRSPACRFTAFVGYEWTGMPSGDNIHRNVVFRNANVPELPASFLDSPTPEGLWSALERDCLHAGVGCDALAIPHNSNLSNGRMWPAASGPGHEPSAEAARRQARIEPLVEITQHKGDSECRAGEADELCGFETLPWARMQESASSWLWQPPAPGVYTREVLAQGLLLDQQVGANPFKFGLIGSTDTHYATPGMVEEDRHPGHGAGLISSRYEVPPIPDQPRFNPGGLAVLWAEENSRDSLFAAMRRRETYGTSGPRMEVRFFGGWEYAQDICTAADFAAQGYAGGVPMGGTLAPAPGPGARPGFALYALRDPGPPDRPGTPLQRLQVVKAWLDDGEVREAVFDVAGDPGNEANVDFATCTPQGAGFDRLCTLWEDPDFSADEHALYYARVIENPSCRWQHFHCLAAGANCSDPSSVSPGLEACCDPAIPRSVQERAWSSPIWYTPRTLEENASQ